MGRETDLLLPYRSAETGFLMELGKAWQAVCHEGQAAEGPLIIFERVELGNKNFMPDDDGLKTGHWDRAVRITVKGEEGKPVEVVRKERLLHAKAIGPNDIQEQWLRIRLDCNNPWAVDEGSVYQTADEWKTAGWLNWQSPGIFNEEYFEPIFGRPKREPFLRQILNELQTNVARPVSIEASV